MDLFAKNLIRKHVGRFNRGIQDIQDKRNQWGNFVSLAKAIMDEIVIEAKTQNLFEHLYSLNSLEIAELSNKLPMLQISFGQHPVGYNENLSNKLIIESGCTLTFVQLVSGHVVCTLYPFQSQLMQRNEKYIIPYIYFLPQTKSKKYMYRVF